MTDGVSHEAFEALFDRVETLEQQVEDLQHTLERETRYEDQGLDHRDATVLDALDEGGRYSPRAIVKFYLQKTDITNSSTAKNRAKALTSRSYFDRRGGELVFQGVDGDE